MVNPKKKYFRPLLGTDNDGFSGDRISENDRFSGTNKPDDVIVKFSNSEITVTEDFLENLSNVRIRKPAGNLFTFGFFLMIQHFVWMQFMS